jgi:hypothetical protein
MGTRARIAYELPSGKFKSIYTHWDGYPSHHGDILMNHYKDAAKVRKLIALGDLSTLAAEIGDKHDWDNSPKGVCNAYGRDRGEAGVGPKISVNLNALNALTQNCGGEYLYVFKGGEWFVAEGGIGFFGAPASEAPGALRQVAEVLAEEELAA